MSEELNRKLPGDNNDQTLALLRGVEAMCITVDKRLTSCEASIERWLIEEHSMWQQVLDRLEVIDAKSKFPPSNVGASGGQLRSPQAK